MNRHFKNTVRLLLVLGVLFSLPIVAKTWSAHGAFAALGTGLAVIVAVLLGPVSFAFSRLFESGFVGAMAIATNTQIVVLLVAGAIVFIAWLRPLLRESDRPVPYLPVTAWAMMGAYFCVAVVFAHTV